MPWIAALLKAQIMLCFLVHNTPLGAITLEEESGALTALHFGIARCNKGWDIVSGDVITIENISDKVDFSIPSLTAFGSPDALIRQMSVAGK